MAHLIPWFRPENRPPMTLKAHRLHLLSTGSEILQGLYPDTNAQHLARFFHGRGFEVAGMAAAPDDPNLVRRALVQALAGADLVVMTGGLGPTEDDINRDVVAEVYGRELHPDGTARRMIEERFDKRGVAMPAKNLVQAMLPEGCVPLYNHWGTAPGFILPATGALCTLVALPGPAREWRPMLEAAWEGPLGGLFPPARMQALETLHLACVPESTVNEMLADLFAGGEETALTLLASTGHIRVRMSGLGATRQEAEAHLAALREEVLRRLGPDGIFASGRETLTIAQVMVEELSGAGETLALAESCTGGMIGAALTDVPGSSAVLSAGWVTYSNEAKARDLGVDPALIDTHGAVSGEVAAAMAEGARERGGTTWAIAVSGVAGPGGGTKEKPVGLVWFAVAGPRGTVTLRRHFPGDRGFIRALAVMQALEALRRCRAGIDVENLLPGNAGAAILEVH